MYIYIVRKRVLHPFQGHSQEFVKMVVEIIVVVFRIVQDMSEQSLESNRMPDEAVYPGPL